MGNVDAMAPIREFLKTLLDWPDAYGIVGGHPFWTAQVSEQANPEKAPLGALRQMVLRSTVIAVPQTAQQSVVDQIGRWAVLSYTLMMALSSISKVSAQAMALGRFVAVGYGLAPGAAAGHGAGAVDRVALGR
jgi:hypothetical protein